jgi:hypothetical protein
MATIAKKRTISQEKLEEIQHEMAERKAQRVKDSENSVVTEEKATSKKKKKKVDTKPKGGVLSAKSARQKADEKLKQQEIAASREKIKKLNDAAWTILSYLEPSFKADWKQAAEEQKVMDIGVYVLGVLNRLSKMVDYWETDIEPDWEQGIIDYTEHLFCEYCKKEIEMTKDTHLRQRFCSNLCAKRYADVHTTGIIFPNNNPGPAEAVIEEKQWRKEAKREGILNG